MTRSDRVGEWMCMECGSYLTDFEVDSLPDNENAPVLCADCDDNDEMDPDQFDDDEDDDDDDDEY